MLKKYFLLITFQNFLIKFPKFFFILFYYQVFINSNLVSFENYFILNSLFISNFF
jgi:hypothetical protein